MNADHSASEMQEFVATQCLCNARISTDSRTEKSMKLKSGLTDVIKIEIASRGCELTFDHCKLKYC